MTFETVNTTALNSIKEEIARGKVLLFVGAGFNAGIPNMAGRTFPLGNQLLERGIEKFEYDPTRITILNSLFSRFKREKVELVNDFLLKELNADKDRFVDLPKYQIIDHIDWLNNSIYTTNYDNVLELVCPRYTYIAQYHFNRGKCKYDDPEQKSIVYLHGKLPLAESDDKGAYNIIASPDDYDVVEEFNFYTNFISQVLTHHCIFIGTSFNEPAFQGLIRKFGRESASSTVERERYLINCDVIEDYDQSIRSSLENLNFKHINASTEVFLTWLNNTFPELNPSTEVQETENYWHLTPEFWDSIDSEGDDWKRFYQSVDSRPEILFQVAKKEKYWVDSGICLKDQYGLELQINEILNQYPNDQIKCLEILGHNGAGKSTFLVNLAYKARQDWDVHYFNQHWKEPDMSPLEHKKKLIIIDEYCSLENINVPVEWLNKQDNCLLIIADNYLNKKKSQFKNELFLIFDFKTYHYDISETFANSIKELEISSKLNFRLSNTIESGNVPRQLVWNLFGSSNPSQLDWKLWETWCDSENKQDWKLLYKIVAVFNYYDITPPLSYISKLLKIEDFVLNAELSERKSPLKIVKGDKLEVRNPAIVEFCLGEIDQGRTFRQNIIKKWYTHFNEYSANPETYIEDQVYLFRNIHRNKKLAKDYSTFGIELPTKVEKIAFFKKMLELTPHNKSKEKEKNEMELAILLMQLRNEEKDNPDIKHEIIELLNKSTSLESRTKLADFYLHIKDPDAKETIEKLYAESPNNSYIVNLVLKYNAKNLTPKIVYNSETTTDPRILHRIKKERLNYLLNLEDYQGAADLATEILSEMPRDIQTWVRLWYLVKYKNINYTLPKVIPFHDTQLDILKCEFADWLKINGFFEIAILILDDIGQSLTDKKTKQYVVLNTADVYKSQMIKLIFEKNPSKNTEIREAYNNCVSMIIDNKLISYTPARHLLFTLNKKAKDWAKKNRNEVDIKYYNSKFWKSLTNMAVDQRIENANHYVLNSLFDYMYSNRRYRLAIDFFHIWQLEEINSNLQTLLGCHTILGHRSEIEELVNRFSKLKFYDSYNTQIQLVHENVVATLALGKVEYNNNWYTINHESKCNYCKAAECNKIKDQRVFANIYKLGDGHIAADRIEPYYEKDNLTDIKTVLDSLNYNITN